MILAGDNPKVLRLTAELLLLDWFDSMRERAGHDYGSGQRHAEIMRRRRVLSDMGVDVYGNVTATDAELLEAFRRVGDPRVRRLELESYRAHTPSSSRTLDTWRRLERSLELRVFFNREKVSQ